jgi:hypothetical protein
MNRTVRDARLRHFDVGAHQTGTPVRATKRANDAGERASEEGAMFKIIVVLATTFVFAGLLIAHPYTSPSVETSGAKIAHTTPDPAASAGTEDRVAEAESWPAPSKTQQDALFAGQSGGNVAAAAAAPRPAAEPVPAQPWRPAPTQENRPIVAANQAPYVPVRPQPVGRPQVDGRHWSQQQADATPVRIEPTPNASIRIVFNRPMPVEQRIHLEHNKRLQRP